MCQTAMMNSRASRLLPHCADRQWLVAGILYENMFSHNLLGAHVEMQSLAVGPSAPLCPLHVAHPPNACC